MTTLKKLVKEINTENAPPDGWQEDDWQQHLSSLQKNHRDILRKIKDIQNDIHHSNWKVSKGKIITNKDDE